MDANVEQFSSIRRTTYYKNGKISMFKQNNVMCILEIDNKVINLEFYNSFNEAYEKSKEKINEIKQKN